MGRFASSWDLVQASGRMLRQDGALALLAALSLVASAAAIALVAGLGSQAGVFPQFLDPQTGVIRPMAVVLGSLLYLLLAFVNVFFAAAIVAGAHARMSGGTASLGASLAAAGRRTGRLLVWAAVTATVGVFLQVLQERGGLVGRLVASLGAMAWHLATFFVVPVLVVEDARLRESLSRSGTLFKRTWGETALAAGIGLLFGALAGLLAIAALIVAGSFDLRSPTGGIVLVAIIAAAALLASAYWAFQGVYKAALHRYASTGQVPSGFTPGQVQAAFSPLSAPGP